jgi:hypothetical protein
MKMTDSELVELLEVHQLPVCMVALLRELMAVEYERGRGDYRKLQRERDYYKIIADAKLDDMVKVVNRSILAARVKP